jgi:hypothetical protein
MNSPFARLLEYADIEGHEAISPAQLDACKLPQSRLSFLKRAPTPDIITCSGCHEACLKPYQRMDTKSLVWCDEPPALGNIELQPDDLQYWKLDIESLSQIVAKNLGLQNTQAIIPNRFYDLGVIEGRTLFLVRGIEWADIAEMFAESRICNSNPLLITLSPPPANASMPTLWAGQVLSLDVTGNIAIDTARLRIALGMTPTQANSFYQRGTEWHICYENHEITMRDSKGMTYIQHLLLHPNKDMSAIELQVLRSKSDGFTVDLLQYDKADPKTIAQVLQRKNDLEKTNPDAPEIPKLKAYLTNSTRGGKSSLFTTANEKARQTVKKAIDTAIINIEKSHDSVGAHFKNCIKTGLFCEYKPDSPKNWNIIS